MNEAQCIFPLHLPVSTTQQSIGSKTVSVPTRGDRATIQPG